MSDMSVLAKSKAEALTSAVTSDGRWQLDDELMCQVFGCTMFGYVLGVGRVVCLMDIEDVKQLAADLLTGLGMGEDYAQRMMDVAFDEFWNDDDTSIFNQLVSAGHSNYASEDLNDLVESVFQNTEQLKQSAEERGTCLTLVPDEAGGRRQPPSIARLRLPAGVTGNAHPQRERNANGS